MANYPVALGPLQVAVASFRCVVEDMLHKMAAMESRIAAQDRLIEQLLMGGEEMARTNVKENAQIDTSKNTCVVARAAGTAAALAGASANTPDGYTVLMARAWVLGYNEGKREGKAE
jgi:hypothetical protein